MKKIFFVIALLLITSFNSFAETCCSQVHGSYSRTEDCCIEFVIFNPYCEGLYLKFQQMNFSTNSFVDDETIPIEYSIEHKMCLLEGQTSIHWRILLMNEFGQPLCYGFEWTPGGIIEGEIDMSQCCNCPIGTIEWLSLEVDDDSPDCPDGCKVTPHLDIPPEITCFKYYSISKDYDDLSEVKPLSEFPNEWSCVDKGQSITYSLLLLKNQNTDVNSQFDDLCLLEKTSEPCEEQPPAPCVPDCFDDEFIPRTPITMELSDCPGCTVKVQYATRIACETWQDIQIIAIDYLSPACEQSCDIDEIYHEVIGGLIAINEMEFEPLEYPNCSDVWRIANGGCWGKEILYYITNGVTYREVCRYHPCENTDCCLQPIRVCRLQGNDGVSILPLGPVQGVSCLPGSSVTDDKGIVYPCEPACHWAGEINGDFGQPITLYTSGKESVEEVVEGSNTAISFKSRNDNFNLFLKINSNLSVSSVLKIYNIKGELIGEESFTILEGDQEKIVDISKLTSGNYLFTITINDHEFQTQKFNIVK